MHVVIHPNNMVLICIMTLGFKDQIWKEIGVSPECPNAFNDVSCIKIEGFAGHDHFMASKRGSFGKLAVNDFVKLVSILV